MMTTMWTVWTLCCGLALAADDVTPQAGETPDRSEAPAVVPPPLLEQSSADVYNLWSGLDVWHVRVPGVRKVTVDWVARQGAIELLGKEDGVGETLGWLMDVATMENNAKALGILSDLHEVEISSSLQSHSGRVRLSVPVNDLEIGVRLWGDVVKAPKFSGRDLKIYQRDIENEYEVMGPSSLRYLASTAMAYSWYPADHAYGTRTDVEAVMGLSPAILKTAHAQWIRRAPMVVMVSGDVDWALIEPMIRAALAGVGADAEVAQEVPYIPPAQTRVVAVELPGQPQVAIRMRLAAPDRTHEAYASFDLASWVLGGHFLSRLNANLREEKGLTYGSRASYAAADTRGHLTVSVDVAAANTAVAVTEIGHELVRLGAALLTQDELGAAVLSDWTSWNNTRQSASRALGLYRRLLDQGVSVEEARAKLLARAELTPEQIQTAIASYLADDVAKTWVLVGDRDALTEQLETLGWEAEWVSATDAVRGRF
jgi:predicted Zn-dependent peptidase